MNWRHFSYENDPKLMCSCGCGRQEMDDRFMQIIDQIRHVEGLAWVVRSGFRCPEYNNRVSSTGFDGPHTTGRAIDVAMFGGRARVLLRKLPDEITGIGVSQRGDYGKRFLHFDNLPTAPGRPRPWLWSYG